MTKGDIRGINLNKDSHISIDEIVKTKASFQEHPHLFLKYFVSSDLKMNIPFANEYSMAWESFGWALSLPEDLKAFPFLIDL